MLHGIGKHMGKVIHRGVDAIGNGYTLVHDNTTGGSKYIWDKGHVWAGFDNSMVAPHTTKPHKK